MTETPAVQGGNSRGQVLTVDETDKIVSFTLNADLGSASLLLGSAQPLANGDWSFDNGDLPGKVSQSIEVDSSGVPTYNESLNTPAYRSFRMNDFYNVPQT